MFPVFSPRAPFQGARARVRGFEFRRLLLARRSVGGISVLILNVPHLFGSTTNEVRGGGLGLVLKPRMDANPHE